WSFGALPASAPQQAFRPPGHFFAEGAALAEGEIYLLTWRNETVFVLNPDDLTPARRLSYDGEGWGLGWDGGRLWRSDGSAFLRPHRPGDFAPAGAALRVHDDGREVRGLNELEWDPATGLMLANVYESDLVAAIDLSDGRVRFWLDAAPLRRLAERDGLDRRLAPADVVLNGLALAPDGQSLWLTGKFWPRLYQIAWPPNGA
ncbi:MAG: glutaminyl-peptide cyclotransferase, partial [Candidatus Adiutrix sp.]|nr:glutaminyl-peptide cyclotransferase [Candidatus Adiutrix sp.]